MYFTHLLLEDLPGFGCSCRFLIVICEVIVKSASFPLRSKLPLSPPLPWDFYFSSSP